MKRYSLTISVDENALQQAYAEGHDISPEECPDIESMISSELNWLSHSGISFSDDLNDLDRSIFIEWSIVDVRDRALQRQLHLDDDDCIEILESLENNYDANLGITWHTLDTALDLFLDD